MKLSKNFTLQEFTKSQTALRKEIDNLPKDPDVVTKLQTLAEEILQPIRNKFGPTVINSGYRCKKLNTAIGGSRKSQHCHGQAIDIDDTYKVVANSDMYNYIKNNLDFDQIIWEFGDDENPNWVHVSYVSKEDNRNRCLKAYKEKGKSKYMVI